MTKGENMKNLVENAFGDIVERTDYGNHKNQLNLFDNLNEIVEENITADDILDFLFNRKGNRSKPLPYNQNVALDLLCRSSDGFLAGLKPGIIKNRLCSTQR